MEGSDEIGCGAMTTRSVMLCPTATTALHCSQCLGPPARRVTVPIGGDGANRFMAEKARWGGAMAKRSRQARAASEGS